MRQHLATVRFEAEDRTSQSGRAYSSVAVAIDGQQELTRLFGPPGHEPFRGLRRGQQVAIAVDSQGKAHLLEQPQADQQQPGPLGFRSPAPAPAPVARQEQAAAYAVPAPVPAAAPASPVLSLAAEWAAAFHALTQAGVPPEQAGSGASCVLIQACGRGR